MKNFLIILAAGILLTAGHSVAGPIVKKHISADADWIFHADYEQFNKSQLGKIVRSEMTNRGVEEKFKNFKEVFSFHPIDDIDNITIYGRGKDREKAVSLIQGRFDKSKLLACVGMNPRHKQIEYHGINIQQWSQQEKDAAQGTREQIMYGCIYGNDLIVLSTGLPAIKQAIGVFEGSQASATDDFFSGMATNSENVFVQVIAKNISEIVGKNPGALMLRRTKQAALAIGENEKNIFVNITLKADSKEAAENIKKLLDGIVAYLTLTGQEQPELAELAQKIQVSGFENTVQINFEQIKSDIIKRLTQRLFP